MKGKERVLALLAGRPVDSLPFMPITMMFATDQIGVPYGEYASDYRVLVEAQLHTSQLLDFDYVSCISDPTREAADCGASIRFFPDQPPAIDEGNALLADKDRLKDLVFPDPATSPRMSDRLRAAELFKQRTGDEKLIEGWIEGPCALGADLRGINQLMLDFFDDPEFIRELFEYSLEMGLRFAKEQVKRGVDIIGVGDAAASLVGPRIYEEFVWPAEKKLVDGLHEMGTLVRLHICGNTRKILSGMGRLGCDIVDLDYPSPVSEGREHMGPDQVLIGNLDPVRALRNVSAEEVYEAIGECHRQAGPRFIVGAGCEVPRDTPAENVRALMKYARSHRPDLV